MRDHFLWKAHSKMIQKKILRRKGKAIATKGLKILYHGDKGNGRPFYRKADLYFPRTCQSSNLILSEILTYGYTTVLCTATTKWKFRSAGKTQLTERTDTSCYHLKYNRRCPFLLFDFIGLAQIFQYKMPFISFCGHS